MAVKANWYDSVWLNAYHAACEIIGRVAPGRRDEFVHAFDVLRTSPDFQPHFEAGLLNPVELEALREVVRAVPNDRLELHEMADFGRFVVHDLPAFALLQRGLTDRVSEWAGEQLEPSYNFLSLYTRMGACEPHLDSPQSKWTLDLCIEQSDPWPITFSQIVPWPDPAELQGPEHGKQVRSDPHLQFQSVTMQPGDAVFFSGSSQWHYRDPLRAAGGKRFCNLLFMHYIPRGSGRLINPANWPDMFGIAEISAVPNLANA